MNLQARVSVLIPTFNRASMLEPTLESIFAQTVPVSEVIVADDGSTDATPEVIKRLSAAHRRWHGRLHYFHQENQGKSVALNHALALATGDWIAYDDSDDLWSPNKLDWQFRALEQSSDCGACFTDSQLVNNSQTNCTAFEMCSKKYPQQLGRIPDAVAFIAHADHGVFMQTVLVRKDIMDRVGEFDSRLRVGQDTDFLFRLACETPLCYVNLPLVEIDRNSDRSRGLTTEFNQKSKRRLEAKELIFEKWLSLTKDKRRDLRKLILSHLWSARSGLANWYIANADSAAARSFLWKASRNHASVSLWGKLVLVYLAPRWMKQRLERHSGRFWRRGN